MKVMMLGWEFPPFIAGGLGTACYGLTRGLNTLGIDVMFVLPRPVEEGARAAAVQEKHLGTPGPHIQTAHALAETFPPSYTPLPQAPAAEDVVVQSKEPLAWIETVTEAVAVRHLQRVEEQVTETRQVPTAGPAHPSAPQPATISAAGQTYRLPEFPHVTFKTVDVLLTPYASAAEHQRTVAQRAQSPKIQPAQLHATSAPSAPAATPTHPESHTSRRWHDRWVTRWENRTFEVVRTDDPASATPAKRNGTHKQTPATLVPADRAAYNRDLIAETQRYADLAVSIARGESFDVIHAHDWMTYLAGLAVAKKTGRPLVVHVHSTEFDRSGDAADPRIVDIERQGLRHAAKIIAVSLLTKRTIIAHYNIAPEKIEVVHNAIDAADHAQERNEMIINRDEKIVLFLGRVTYQKGPEFFLAAARKVLNYYDAVKFIIAGSGDLIRPTIELAAAMGIGPKVLFTGFLKSKDVEKIYRMADLYVMPSVSEPFGIAPLEAMAHDVPVIVSKDSGVAEVIQHALKVDFGDVDDLADKILAVLRHPELAGALRKHGRLEVHQLSWRDAAEKVLDVYSGVLEEA